MEKMIIYQVLPRLFANTEEHCLRQGSLEQNGSGKLSDFTIESLTKIKRFGATHIWYTGIIEHATQTDYSRYGIARDNPLIVKGKAGSPYAIKDYYDIDPDLATNPSERQAEFDALTERTHSSGLKMIIDFVPNHLSRQYKSDARPQGVEDFGETDNKRCTFSANNNFYYIPGQTLCTNFAEHNLFSEPYVENPAKATGNDHFDAFPSRNDWYETVKLNYGVDYLGGHTCYFKPIPNTWLKMLSILLYWASRGVDGFRCDMAEMVPVEFWQWAIAEVKKKYADVIFIAEVYNPNLYRDYIFRGGFDFLYDKVGLYDTLRAAVCGYASARSITGCWQSVDDIQHYMLNFLENHDEQRIASDFFAGEGKKACAALVVSACMNTNPFMVYAGQEFGERGMDSEGFSGKDGRTTIFDYWSVKTLRDNALGSLSREAKDLSGYYKKILGLCSSEKALSQGAFYDFMYVNDDNVSLFDYNRCYAFMRKHADELLLITANFGEASHSAMVRIPAHAFSLHHIEEGTYKAVDLITGKKETIALKADERYRTSVPAFGAKILKIRLSDVAKGSSPSKHQKG